MFTKPQKTRKLLMLEVLHKRMSLTTDSRLAYDRLQSGYQGEFNFHKTLQDQPLPTCLQLYGLQLKIDGSECQIDSLLIFQNEIYLLEVKNYQGDYYYDNNKWFTVAQNKEIKNPLHQLNRSDLLLREFLSRYHSHFQLRSLIVFMHPAFQLYQAPLQTPIVFPGQLNRFINRLQKIPHQINTRQQKLFDDLKSAHLTESAYEQLPKYNYSQLKKGITCAHCKGYMELAVNSKLLICDSCKITETMQSAILRSIHEYATLFPEEQIRVNNIEEWTNHIVSKHTIRHTLQQNLALVRNGKYSYYTVNRLIE